jgi:hypothetical protein
VEELAPVELNRFDPKIYCRVHDAASLFGQLVREGKKSSAIAIRATGKFKGGYALIKIKFTFICYQRFC